jgi:acyl carrier protein
VETERIHAVVLEFISGLPDTPERVSNSASFEELGVDSMSTMDLLVKVEKEFGVEVPDEQLPMIVNIEDLVNFVASAQEVNR